MLDLGLLGKTAIVTGANHGIGAATSSALAAQGANVVLTYLRQDPTSINASEYPPEYGEARAQDANWVVRTILSKGGSAISLEVDLRNAAEIMKLFETAEEHYGQVDIIVNNASSWLADTYVPLISDRFKRTSYKLSVETWESVSQVDARGAALVIQEFAERLISREGTWGRIIGLTSGGRAGFPGEVSYGAAKAAMESVTLSAASELSRYGVTANLIHPPAVDTGWLTDDAREHISDRIARPSEIADVILLLLSDQAVHITGQSVYVT